MAVDLELPADPAMVAVARLIATSLARQAAAPEELVDEIRLAVGEACARAVAVQQPVDPARPIRVRIEHDAGFVVDVVDDAGPAAVPPAADHDHLFGVDLADGLSLALLRGLVDDLAVTPTPTGTRVRLTWPLPGSVPAAG
jgi:serine/threonine-protein kinase RsbW